MIHLAKSDSETTLCGRRAVWNVREKYVRATCPECKAAVLILGEDRHLPRGRR
jgi:hypothetical protein